MEHWRSFFAQAESDLWTIIHQAILVAASDFPAEFKYKRCEIAEILFARRPGGFPNAGSVDATRLSESVITNVIGDTEKGPHHADRDNLRTGHASRTENKLADTQSQGTVSKAPTVESRESEGEKRMELGAHVENDNAFRDHRGADDLAMHYVILQDVNMIKNQMMNASDQSEDRLLRSLHALEQIDVTVEILKATDIGREVNKFRKHSSVHVRSLVKQLVRTWKGMVDEWVRNAETVAPLNASGEKEVCDRDASHKNSSYTAFSTQMSLQRSSVQLYPKKLVNDSASAVRSHLHGDHAVEEMGSSRVESEDLYKPVFMERKPDLCGQQGQFRRANLNGAVVCEHGNGSEDKFWDHEQYDDGSQKSGYGKTLLAQKVSSSNHERIDTMKRRLPIDDQQAEHAKKHQDMPTVLRAPVLSKRGAVSARLPACVKSQHLLQKR